MDDTGTIIPADYAELARLAWNRDPSRPITGDEAFGLYERNWRHVDAASLSALERGLIKRLADRFGGGHLLTTKQAGGGNVPETGAPGKGDRVAGHGP